MARSRTEIRHRLFARGVEAFRRITRTTDELYYCPICTLPFPRSALTSGHLTLEHIPPRSQAGRPLALTCYDCNSLRGHKLDAAVLERAKLFDLNEAFRTGGYHKGRARFEFDGTRVNVTYELRDRELTIIPPKSINSPDDLQRFREAVAHQIPKAFHFTPRIRFHRRFSQLGDLRTAYLAAFVKFGYTYAFNSRLRRVREQLCHPEREVLVGWWVFPDKDSIRSPLMLMLDRPLPALAVHLRTAIILLPWLDEAAHFYHDLSALTLPGDGRINLHGSSLDWPHTLEMTLDLPE